MKPELSAAFQSFDEGETDGLAERRLFRAVITNAALDATGRCASGVHASAKDFNQAAAVRWFREGGGDFRMVCALAGLEASYVRSRVLAYLEAADANAGKRLTTKRNNKRRKLAA